MEYEKTDDVNEIRILNGIECETLRALWSEVFWEDSRQFTDYYFQNKARQNTGYVHYQTELVEQAEQTEQTEQTEQMAQAEQTAQAVSMLYLTPYRLAIRSGETTQFIDSEYLVGVATKREYRHQGYMRQLLVKAMQDKRAEGRPFCFLMPADPEIYRPFQFQYIYDRDEIEVDAAAFHALIDSERIIADIQEQHYVNLKQFNQTDTKWNYVNQYLEEYYQVYTVRDSEYFELLQKELAAQNGAMLWLTEQQEEQRKQEGYCFYTEEEEVWIQEASQSFLQAIAPCILNQSKKPIIMARILDVKQMLQLLRTRWGTIEFVLQVEDPLLADNNGCWQVQMSPKHCTVQKLTGQTDQGMEIVQEAAASVCRISIEKLTAFCFGYETPQQCFEDPLTQSQIEKLQRIDTLQKVYLNEID